MAGNVGLDCVGYLNTGTTLSPIWVPILLLRDVTISGEKGMAEMVARVSRWKGKKGTLKDMPIDLVFLEDTTDVVLGAFLDAFWDDALVDVMFLNGPNTENGAEGPRGVFEVAKYERGEPLEEGLTINVRLELAYGYEPDWVVISA